MVGQYSGFTTILKGENMRKHLGAALLACLAILCMFQNVSAQVNTADILGTVTDAGGAVMPNVKVTVQNTATNETKTATTSADGRVHFQPDAVRAVHDYRRSAQF